MRSITRHPAAFAALLLVLLLGIAVAWAFSQLKLVHDRRFLSEALRRENKVELVASMNADAKAPWLRRYFGDVPVDHVVRYSAMTDLDQQQVVRLFPEASILWSGGNPELLQGLQRAAIQPAAPQPTLASSPLASTK